MTKTISTIGYEGAEIGAFLSTLAEAGIRHVIDVRDVPVSRKRGFSKGALSSALQEQGIGYTHLKPLGDPKAGREAMRGGKYELFLDIYTKHIRSPAAQVSLVEAVKIAETQHAVLLCFERDHRHCHRTLVAGMMNDLVSMSVRHLGVREKGGTRLGGRNGASVGCFNAVG